MTSRSSRPRVAVAGLAFLAIASATALQNLPATAADGGSAKAGPARSTRPLTTIGDTLAGLDDITRPLDAEGNAIVAAPSAAQKTAAAALGSDVSVTWNDSGTPESILPRDGVLAPAVAGTHEQAARGWLHDHASLLGLPVADVEALEMVNDQQLAGSRASAVLFRQRFGSLTPATRSMATVGVAADGSIAYVSSSLTKASGAAPTPTLSPLEGWLKAAASVQRGVADGDLAKITSTVAGAAGGGWTRLDVPGFAQKQLARTRAFARADGVVRPVIEADVIDSKAGNALAYRIMVDAISGDVLFRQNAVENSNDAFPIQGSYPNGGCSDIKPFELADANTKTIAVVAAAVIAADDISIKLYGPGSAPLGTFDLSTSPETATYSPGTTLAAGTYGVAVCAFDDNQIGGPFTATVVTTDTGASTSGGTGTVLGQPKWRAFQANPSLPTIGASTGFDPDNSVIECWYAATPGCSAGESHENGFDFGPWDQINAAPTFTTIGNNANTHEAWGSPLTPGGGEQAPVSPTRDYTQAFTDVWNNSRCSTTNLVPGGNDINAVVTNLFVGHNRIHDYAYALGFTEANYNLQLDNGGLGGVGGDQEIGNVQAGALVPANDPTGAVPVSGRDNANQIAMQDGVPGITNQYLFQPIAGGFYSPCADGALDTGIYGHEYTHAISNRMVGGADDGLTSEQGGAMGESWSDLNAGEYQFENNYPTGTNPWALGAYTTGNFAKGIRDYAINENPLNFSDYGFDTTGPEVHADGEIWNGTQWEVRQALVDKWNAQFPYTDTALQRKCGNPSASPTGQLDASACPGNRRWIQLIYDAWLMQPGADSMLIARDTMIAADQMRFGGENRDTLWAAFARRGMGKDAVTTPDSDEPTPSFASPYGANGSVTFLGAGAGKVYVGDYEARATPIADLDGATALPATASFTPGVYRITYVSPTKGFRRFDLTVTDGSARVFSLDDAATNVASAAAGASVITSTAGSLNPESLIDGTEATNWGGVTADNVDVSHPSVTVALAGGLQTISSAKVSALLHPAPAGDALPVIGARADDPASGSRFTALRKFALEACTTNCSAPGAVFTRFYESPDDAFPADIPRPVAPDQTMRTARFAPVQAAAVRLVTLQNQCTGQAKYAGEQDSDPLNDTDCKTASDRGTIVHAAEMQIFSGAIPDDPQGVLANNALPANLSTVATGTKLIKTKTRIRLPRVQQVKGRESTKVKYQVVGIGGTSLGRTAGKVVIKLDGKKLKKKAIAVTLKRGKKVVGNTFRVPRTLGYGKHYLQVVFTSANGALYTSSKSRRILLTVVRTRPNVR